MREVSKPRKDKPVTAMPAMVVKAINRYAVLRQYFDDKQLQSDILPTESTNKHGFEPFTRAIITKLIFDIFYYIKLYL